MLRNSDTGGRPEVVGAGKSKPLARQLRTTGESRRFGWSFGMAIASSSCRFIESARGFEWPTVGSLSWMDSGGVLPTAGIRRSRGREGAAEK